MKHFFWLLSTLFLCTGLGLFLIQCDMATVDRKGGGGIIGGIFGGGGNDRDGSKDGGDSGGRNDDEREPGGGGQFCRDFPQDPSCICRRDPDDSRCTQTTRETASEAHKRLKDRYSAWMELDPVSTSVVEEFLSDATISHGIENLRVYLDLEKEATENPHTYGGELKVLVEVDDGSGGSTPIEGFPFRSGSGGDALLNIWSKNFPGHRGLGFHGFFEDMQHGSVILVVDDVETTGRGEGREVLGAGSLWFMRFKHEGDRHNCHEGGKHWGLDRRPVCNRPGACKPARPNKKCWFVGGTPFDCRAWKTGSNGVQTSRSLEPADSCYKKLGDFGRSRRDVLDLKSAFSLEGNEPFL